MDRETLDAIQRAHPEIPWRDIETLLRAQIVVQLMKPLCPMTKHGCEKYCKAYCRKAPR